VKVKIMANRSAAEAVIYEYIEKILPGSENVRIYKELFASMDDAAFDAFMKGLEDGSIRLAIIAPNMGSQKLDVKRNLDIAKELGHNFFERIWMYSKDGNLPYLTPIPYLVVQLPLRRQAQLLVKKISIPQDNRSVDHLSGQPTGSSKGSKISYPELQILASQGLDESIVEMIKFRGGDAQGFNAMNNSIAKTGGVSMKSIAALGTKVKATQTLSTILTAMHYRNSLLG
jgi:hypothetical protein